MPEKPDTLEILIRVPSEVEASLIVQRLADDGIAAMEVGGSISGFRAGVPGDVSVLVKHGDLARAKGALESLREECFSEQDVDNREE